MNNVLPYSVSDSGKLDMGYWVDVNDDDGNTVMRVYGAEMELVRLMLWATRLLEKLNKLTLAIEESGEDAEWFWDVVGEPYDEAMKILALADGEGANDA
jgi:hypothetical protein